MRDTSRDFLQLVNARGASLRRRSFTDLIALNEPTENLTLAGRNGSISIIVEPQSSVCVKIVVQGFLDSRLFASWKTVALHGFYMDASGTISEMENHEFWDYD